MYKFREKKFRFDSFSPTEDLLQNTIVTQYSNLIKRFDSFMVKIKSGRIRKGEVIGVTGANALGKTTFMKIMAGIEKTDEGVVEINPKISYKPQYISQDYDGDVKSLLYSRYQNVIEGSSVEEQIIIPMGIKKLYEKNFKKFKRRRTTESSNQQLL